MEKGYLIVQTTTTDMIYPVTDVLVNVRKEDESHDFVTDRNGKTEKIEIEAPDTAFSTNQSDEESYTSVDVTVKKDGYYTIIVRNAQVFPKETSLLYVNMIPLPENENEKTLEYFSNSQNL